MKKHDLLKSDTSIIRVLDIRPDKVLMIDCIKRNMPVWVKPSVLASCPVCSIEALNEATWMYTKKVDKQGKKVDKKEKRKGCPNDRKKESSKVHRRV